MELHFLFNGFKRVGPKSLSTNLKTIRIRKIQNMLLKKYNSKCNKLIIFLTPGFDTVQGGILSIHSIYEETKKLEPLHKAKAILCVIPGHPRLLKYTKFENRSYLHNFSDVLLYFKNLKSIMINIPECYVNHFLTNITYFDYLKLRKIDEVRINIMLQNIEAFSRKDLAAVAKLKRLGLLSCTTAYERDSTPEMRKKLGCSIHFLSWYLSPKKYTQKEFSEKENLMIISPDHNPMKAKILDMVTAQLPQLKTMIIQNLTYEEYKEVISRAKWALTFGEGLDGYFVETVFSGGIGFSAYNPAFFTEDFKCLRTVYNSYDTLRDKIIEDIRTLDNEKAFANYQQTEFELCKSHFNYEKYVNNIRLFYEGKYTIK